ncbi:uncharacterized protein Tco025E_05919 [Trypanosoma conorhini]|uniref:Uncharacterized protein n=1 Tax=Trypanosoma conorhini TaxID=83891 RepID=A0A422P9F6_9TRYP|nr:uncharacterized protein Tco025E_05919 [Trypanosoma conorhini]RNF14361.1 hypothetical protein Tco025E_05919 [Trypanosoma conorhini]
MQFLLVKLRKLLLSFKAGRRPHACERVRDGHLLNGNGGRRQGQQSQLQWWNDAILRARVSDKKGVKRICLSTVKHHARKRYRVRRTAIRRSLRVPKCGASLSKPRVPTNVRQDKWHALNALN